MKNKYYIITVLVTILYSTVVGSQTLEKETNYSYEATYTKLVTGSLYASYVVHLDQYTFENASKIIVSLEGLNEDNYITGRSIQYNFSDRVLGWDAAIEKRMVDASVEERQIAVDQIEQNDKIKIDQSSYLVQIDFGPIKAKDSQPTVTIEIEYKDLTRSAPLLKVQETIQ